MTLSLIGWIGLAILGYFFAALARVIDKFLLSKAIPDAVVFVFYVGILSAFSIILVPFGVEFVSLRIFIILFGSGVSFVIGLYFLYQAFIRYEVSRVIPLVVSVGPFLSLLSSRYVFHQSLNVPDVYAVTLLVIGGVLLSWKKNQRHVFHGALIFYAFASSIFASMSLVLLREAFILQTPFLTGFVWARMGMFVSALFLLILPSARMRIMKAPRPKAKHSILFVLNKSIGGSAFFFIDLALQKGDVAEVHALGSFEYFFVFLLTSLLSFFWPTVLKEDFSSHALFVKVAGAISLLGALYLLSF